MAGHDPGHRLERGERAREVGVADPGRRARRVLGLAVGRGQPQQLGGDRLVAQAGAHGLARDREERRGKRRGRLDLGVRLKPRALHLGRRLGQQVHRARAELLERAGVRRHAHELPHRLLVPVALRLEQEPPAERERHGGRRGREQLERPRPPAGETGQPPRRGDGHPLVGVGGQGRGQAEGRLGGPRGEERERDVRRLARRGAAGPCRPLDPPERVFGRRPRERLGRHDPHHLAAVLQEARGELRAGGVGGVPLPAAAARRGQRAHGRPLAPPRHQWAHDRVCEQEQRVRRRQPDRDLERRAADPEQDARDQEPRRDRGAAARRPLEPRQVHERGHPDQQRQRRRQPAALRLDQRTQGGLEHDPHAQDQPDQAEEQRQARVAREQHRQPNLTLSLTSSR